MSSVRRWAGPAISVGVLAVMVWRLGTGPFIAGLEAIDFRALLAAGAIFFVATVCGAWRWAVVARGLGLRLSLPRAVAAYYRAVFLNLVLPGGVAGDIHRGVSHGREVRDVGCGLRAVLWERGAGQVVQVVLTISVLLILPSPVHSVMPFVAVAVVVLGAVLLGLVKIGGECSLWAVSRNAVVADVRNGLLHESALPTILLTSVLVTLGHAATFLVAARSVGVDASIPRLLPLSLLAVLAMVLPSIAGWGPREGATASIFAAAGLGAGRGAATAVAYGVLVLAASLPGAIVLVANWRPRRHVAKARSRARIALRPENVDA